MGWEEDCNSAKIILMKKIFVPASPVSDGDNPRIANFGIRKTYLEKLSEHGLTPVLVPHVFKKESIDELYKECGGVFFPGGADLDSRLYGERPHLKNYGVNREFDEFQIDILRRTLRYRKPFLGICRGAQILAVAAGGSLYQHLPDVFPREEHNVPSYADLGKIKHEVVVVRDSRAFQILKKEKIIANSGHHQAVKNPGAGLNVSGLSPAGVAEILEHQDPNYFCFGLQCHPEAETGDFEPFFEEFARAVAGA